MVEVKNKELDPSEYFRLCSGEFLKSLKELQQALGDMNQEVFQHHVNSERNDFVNWIKGVFNDEVLAAQLMKASDAKEMADVIGKLNAPGKKKKKKKAPVVPSPKELKPKRILTMNYPQNVMIKKIAEMYKHG